MTQRPTRPFAAVAPPPTLGDAIWEYLERQPGFQDDLARAEADLAEGNCTTWKEYQRQRRGGSEPAGSDLTRGNAS
jgi:hypothetical protein